MAKSIQAACCRGALMFCLAAGAANAQIYNLVEGLDHFNGSAEAWRILGQNGFVVADPGYKQMYEAYLDDALPVFITADSAWHTYHLFLEDGIRQLESAQSRAMPDFSRRLWSSAAAQAKTQDQDFSDLARFAAMGLALQDETFRASLSADQKRLAHDLLAGNGEPRVEIGFPISAPAFLAAASEGASAELTGYRAARQWYATVDFRLSDERETRLALCLSWLIDKDPDLLQLWKQLSEPWDSLLVPAEDGSVPVYWGEAGKLLGPNFTLASVRKNTGALQSRLAKLLPPPRIDDQLSGPGDSGPFGQRIKGFRLLPPRRLPCEVCFQNTVAPRLPGRLFPSGLDFFVASPELRSPAAERLLRAAAGGEVADAVRQADCGPLPGTLHGQALHLLARLQEPAPEGLAPALRSTAWANEQVWSQLGAWVEERHAGALRATPIMSESGMSKPPGGVVAPCPEFFAGLGKLALDTAATLDKAGIDEPFDSKTAARKLLEGIQRQEGFKSEDDNGRMAGEAEQFQQFLQHYMEPRKAEFENNPPASQKLMNDLETLARRCSTQTAPAEADRQVLLGFYQERQAVPKLLRDFATVCDKLAGLARKHRDGAALTDDELAWIGGYGATLARFQFRHGNPAGTAPDDFPIVSRLRAVPASNTMFYAGLGRPHALYIILPADGRLQLYRGAVMTYREFVRSNSLPLDDASWRELAGTGGVPPPPAFTRDFYAERNAADLLKMFSSLTADTVDYKDASEALEELQSRVTDQDLPLLIAALGKTRGPLAEQENAGIAAAIATLRWEPRQRELLELMEKNDGEQARIVTPILLQRPQGLDAAFLSANFDRAPARVRRVYCALLGRVAESRQALATLLRALADTNSAVRLEAATVLGAASSQASQKTAPLLQVLNDDNLYVVAAAAGALARLRAANAAPALLARLEQRAQAPEPSASDLRKQGRAVQDFVLTELGDQPPPRFMNAFRSRFNAGLRRAGGLSLEAPDAPALIEALGELHYQPAEEPLFGLLDGLHGQAAGEALKRIAPDRLARRLIAEACDKKADPQLRDRALLLLGTPPVTSATAELIPLLDDTTVVPGQRPMPGREWRLCDRAAATLATLMGRTVRIVPVETTEQRDQQIDQVRQSLKAAY